MLNRDEKKRYNRHLILENFGVEAQEKLKTARILMVGAGGLGCPALQYLTAAGIGELGIIDHDTVDETNLQRQVLFSGADIGKPKAEEAVKKLKEQNPFVRFKAFNERLTENNALKIIRNYDLVIDGSDNFKTRYIINDSCVILNKPMVYGSIFKYEGQVSVFNYKDGPTYRCLFPDPPSPGEMPSCSEIGVLGVLPGVIGSLQAAEAIKLITGKGEILSGKLLIINIFDNSQSIFNFVPVEKNKKITEVGIIKENTNEGNNKLTKSTLSDWLKSGKEMDLVDIREEWEFDEENIGGRNIPFHELPARLNELDQDWPVVFICKRGENSALALKMFNEKFPEKEAYSVIGGIEGQ